MRRAERVRRWSTRFIADWGGELGSIPFQERFLRRVLGQGKIAQDRVRIANGKLVIVPIERPKFDLETMLEQITEDNLHAEVNVGPAVGQEVW